MMDDCGAWQMRWDGQQKTMTSEQGQGQTMKNDGRRTQRRQMQVDKFG